MQSQLLRHDDRVLTMNSNLAHRQVFDEDSQETRNVDGVETRVKDFGKVEAIEYAAGIRSPVCKSMGVSFISWGQPNVVPVKKPATFEP